MYALPLREQAQSQLNFGGLQVGATESQHDVKSLTLHNDHERRSRLCAGEQ